MPSDRALKKAMAKRQRKADAIDRPKRRSVYSRKRAFLNQNGGWGSDYPTPKPWRS